MKKIYLVETPLTLQDKNAQLYKKSIKKMAEEKSIEVVQYLVESQESMSAFSGCPTPTLILEPCEFDKPLFYNNLETNCTANVIADICRERFNVFKNVLIINRSELIGRPLANLLLDDNCTVSIAHSQTNYGYLDALIKYSSIVIIATGQDMNYLDLSKNIVIDVGGNYSGESRTYIGMGEVGKLTTEYMLSRV